MVPWYFFVRGGYSSSRTLVAKHILVERCDDEQGIHVCISQYGNWRRETHDFKNAVEKAELERSLKDQVESNRG
jgi:phage terminase large subunit